MNRFQVDDWTTDDALIDCDDLPEIIPEKSVLCIAKPAPLTERALPLRIANRYADNADCRVIVTSSVGAEETIAQQKSIGWSTASRLGVVDTTADEHLAALYQNNPTVFLPRSGDLTQISLALEELEESLSSSCSKTHVVFRSLTPILAESSLDGVRSVLKCVIEHQRTDSSLTVFSVEYTEHGEATMTALEKLVDGIVWTEQTANDGLRLTYQRARNL